MKPLPVHGRGASSNPSNRFTGVEVQRDDWNDPDDPGPETTLYRDASKSVIATNDSPDVGFEASLNPYRGCEHGCVYCLDPGTPVLLADGRTRPIGRLKIGDEIYGTRRRGHYRRFVATRVLDTWETRKPAYRIALEDGTELFASGDHRFLTERGWKFVTGKPGGSRQRPHLTRNDRLMGVGAFAAGPVDSPAYRRGYLTGMIRGDGHLGPYRYPRDGGGGETQHPFRLALADRPALERTDRYLRALGIGCRRFVFSRASTARREVRGVQPHPRFFHQTDPAIQRKTDITEVALKPPSRLGIVAIEPVGTRTLVDITTGTGDFIANGVVSHNCYARPTHEYFGLSAGLDFETKIFVKEDAPELLRERLMDPAWQPTPLAMSGVTDPYQPVERRMKVTRKCLEVLAEFRNPVSIVTKSHLVTRDADLLAELAGHDAARVNLSITTLRNEVQRVMEPRTAVPKRRLRAIRELSDAGVPVGVMVAPVVPGLTDHEMPEILEAAVEAGARSASYIVLRLPHGVEDLFVGWLEQHFPDRKGKIVSRLRSLRGGRLNDPRFGTRMSGEGEFAEQIRQLFDVTGRRLGLDRDRPSLSTAAFRRPPRDGEQLGLFGSD